MNRPRHSDRKIRAVALQRAFADSCGDLHRLPVHARCALQNRNLCGWISRRFYFAIGIWGALALPNLLESAIFVRLHRLVVIGQLLDWLTTSVLNLCHDMVVAKAINPQRQWKPVKN